MNKEIKPSLQKCVNARPDPDTFQMKELKVSLPQIVQVLEAKKNEMIKSGGDGGYPKMIREVMRYWTEQEENKFMPFDPKEKKDIGFWYDLFDDLLFYLNGKDFEKIKCI